MHTILLVSTADTELLAAAASGAGYLTANPARIAADDVTGLAARADLVVLRLLGGRQAWPQGVAALTAALAAAGRPLVALGGEASPDAELMALSTVPAGVATETLVYLREGGPENLRELARFLSDTVFLTGEGFDPPRPMPGYGIHQLPGPAPADGPVVAVVFYRAHELSGNTAFVDTLCAALAEVGARPLPIFCGSLRGAGYGGADAGLADLLEPADAVITTVLAAGGSAAADATGESDWDAGVLARLDVPVLQGLCLTSSRAQWAASNAALAPIDAAMQVAIPEFDGRLITVPFSFKEEGPDGIPRYAADPERAARLAGIAVRYARLAATPNAAKRVAIMLSSYPTKHARVGNAVGLDTPASAVALLQAMREAGYDLGDGFPADGDTLIHALIAAGGHDIEWLTEDPAPRRSGPRPARRLPPLFRESAERAGLVHPRTLGRPAGWPVHRRDPRRLGRHRARLPAVRPCGADDPAAARLRREPGRDLPRPRPAAVASLPGRLPVAGRPISVPTRSSTWVSTGRWSGCPARASACPPGARRTRCSATCRWCTRSSSTTRGRGPRPSAARTR